MKARLFGTAAVMAALVWSTPTGSAVPPPASRAPAAPTGIVVGAVQVVEPLGPGIVVRPRLVSDRSGVSTIVWERDSRIKAARSLADGGWGAVVDLGPGRAPDVAVDGRGAVTAAWRTAGGRDLVTRRFAGGSWRAPVTLTGPSLASFVHVWPYRVASNSAGDTVVVWSRGYGMDPGAYQTRLEVAYRPHGGEFGPVVELDRRNVAPLSVFLHRRGAATLVYVDHDSSIIREREPDGVWGAPQVLDGDVGGAAAAPDGRLLVSVFDGTGLMINERRPGVGWLAPDEVAPITRSRGVAPMGMDGTGRGAIAFTRNGQRLRVADRPSGDLPWSTPAVVSPVGQRATEIQLAVGPGGAVGAAWVDSAAEHPRVWVAGLLPGAGWSEAVALTGPRSRSLYYLDLDFETDGDLVASWADHLAGEGGRRVVTRTVNLTGG